MNVGEKTKLDVSYATAGRPGLFEKQVTFTTNLPDEEKIEIFHMKGIVKEAPSAKISVAPRRVVLEGGDRDTGKKQAFAITNDGTLPLEITRIAFKDGSKVFFDSAKSGKLVIAPGATQDLDLDLDPESGSEQVQKLILIECNARNAGSTGYFLIVRYEKR